MRSVTCYVTYNALRTKWFVEVESDDHKELTAQEIVDAVGDYLMYEGELDIIKKRNLNEMDS